MLSYSEKGPATVEASDLPSDPSLSTTAVDPEERRHNTVDPNGYDNGYTDEGQLPHYPSKGDGLLLLDMLDPDERTDPKRVDQDRK